MDVIEWHDPPNVNVKRHSRLSVIASKFRERPHVWGQLLGYKWDNIGDAKNYAAGIRHGKTRAWAPKGSFEAVACQIEGTEDEFSVWVRYVGANAPTAPITDIKHRRTGTR